MATATLSRTPIMPESGHPVAFTRETLVRGRPVTGEFLRILGQDYAVIRGAITTVSLDDEWYEDVADPAAVIETLRLAGDLKPDLFTFRQRIPDTEPRHPYFHEWEELAVLPVTTYDEWWNNRIKSRTRSLIRKSEREGLDVRECEFDDAFVRGMTAIFNETPVRQGRRFWHYGKDEETVRRQFSRFLHRERMIGAFVGEEMAGFIMLGNAGRYALPGQILSAVKHRNRSPNNALIAKAVELCAQQGLDHLVYFYWTDDSLAEFKRRCGFEPVRVPRYWVPLTAKGRLALRLGMHRGVANMLPPGLRSRLKALRSRWLARTAGGSGAH